MNRSKMPQESQNVQSQIKLIQEAMKKAGLWSDQIPLWVQTYEPENIPDIWQWLQYIYLPMRVNGTQSKPHYIAPILSSYMNTESKFHEILHLVIELDSISSTIEKK